MHNLSEQTHLGASPTLRRIHCQHPHARKSQKYDGPLPVATFTAEGIWVFCRWEKAMECIPWEEAFEFLPRERCLAFWEASDHAG